MSQLFAPFHLSVTAKTSRPGVLILVLGITVFASCKSNAKESCAKACEHATNIVLDLISSKGTVSSQALEERSGEMQLSCSNECKTGELDPKCLLDASNYESLHKCSKAPEKKPEPPSGDGGSTIQTP